MVLGFQPRVASQDRKHVVQLGDAVALTASGPERLCRTPVQLQIV